MNCPVVLFPVSAYQLSSIDSSCRELRWYTKSGRMNCGAYNRRMKRESKKFRTVSSVAWKEKEELNWPITRPLDVSEPWSTVSRRARTYLNIHHELPEDQMIHKNEKSARNAVETSKRRGKVTWLMDRSRRAHGAWAHQECRSNWEWWFFIKNSEYKL